MPILKGLDKIICIYIKSPSHRKYIDIYIKYKQKSNFLFRKNDRFISNRQIQTIKRDKFSNNTVLHICFFYKNRRLAKPRGPHAQTHPTH